MTETNSLWKRGLLWVIMLVLMAMPVLALEMSDFASGPLWVNAAIVAGVLFFAMVLWMKDTTGTKAYILYAFIAATAIFIAWKFGQGNPGLYFWQGSWAEKYMKVHVLVNMAVLVTVLLLAKAFVPGLKDRLGTSKASTVALTILIIAISIGSALHFENVRLDSDDEVVQNAKYIWQMNHINKIKVYLLGEENYTQTIYVEVKEGDGWAERAKNYGRTFELAKMAGIGREVKTEEKTVYCKYKTSPSTAEQCAVLKPPHLWVFIVTMLLYMWVFGKYVFKEEKQKLGGWILAIILGAQHAYEGMGLDVAFNFGYYILIMMLYNGMKENSGKALAAGMAFGIANTLATTAFGSLVSPLPSFDSTTFLGNFLTGYLIGWMLDKKGEGDSNWQSAKKLAGWLTGGRIGTRPKRDEGVDAPELDELQDDFKVLIKRREELDKVKKDITEAETIMKDAKGDLETAQQDRRKLEEDLETEQGRLDDEIRKNLQETKPEKVTQFQNRIDSINAEISGLENEKTGLRRDRDNEEDRQNALPVDRRDTTKVDRLGREIREIDTKISEKKSQIEEIRQEMLDAIGKRGLPTVGAIEGKIRSLITQIEETKGNKDVVFKKDADGKETTEVEGTTNMTTEEIAVNKKVVQNLQDKFHRQDKIVGRLESRKKDITWGKMHDGTSVVKDVMQKIDSMWMRKPTSAKKDLFGRLNFRRKVVKVPVGTPTDTNPAFNMQQAGDSWEPGCKTDDITKPDEPPKTNGQYKSLEGIEDYIRYRIQNLNERSDYKAKLLKEYNIKSARTSSGGGESS